MRSSAGLRTRGQNGAHGSSTSARSIVRGSVSSSFCSVSCSWPSSSWSRSGRRSRTSSAF